MTRYAHNDTILVKVGDEVQRGQAIATVGSTGRSTGPHVHFEVLRGGVQIDPMASSATEARGPVAPTRARSWQQAAVTNGRPAPLHEHCVRPLRAATNDYIGGAVYQYNELSSACAAFM